MKRALLNLYRVVMSYRQILPVFLLTLVSFSVKAQCPPTLTAIPASANVCAGDSVRMACMPSSGTTWQWYKDGTLIPGATNSTCYAYDAGNYTVMVGGCPFPSVPVTVSMRPLPLVSLFSSATIICEGQQVSLFVTTGPNVVWVWIDPPSLFGTQTNPINQTLYSTTTYQIIGADQTTNCANTSMVTIQVNPELIAGTVQSNTQICPGDTPNLITATPSTGGSGTYTYQWQKSTTSASGGFSDIPGANGLTYQPGPTAVTTWYRLVTSSPPCLDEYSNAVVVQVNPNPTVSSAPTKAICSGDNINYHPNSAVTGTTYTWTSTVTSGTASGNTASGSGNIHDILSLPANSITPAQITYIITPTGPAPTNCPGVPFTFTATVNPIPTVSNVVLSQGVCAGLSTTAVVLQSTLASATFTWTAVASAGITGFQASGSGNIPSMQMFNSLLTVGTVTYTVTPHGPAPTTCDGPSVNYVITVNPSPIVSNTPMQQTICTGANTTAVVLTSNVPATTFTWTATASAGITGFTASGTNSIPLQTISNSTNATGTVTYHIIPSASSNGCAGIPKDYIINVNPEPVVLVAQNVLTHCSGTTTSIPLSSNVTGTTFSWTSSAPGSITGHSNGTGNVIAQTLANTSNAPHNVIYTITPTYNGCSGNPLTVTVTVFPATLLSIVPAFPVSCSGQNVTISLIGNVPGITFTWTASAVGNVTGFLNGTGSTISQTLINNDNIPRLVTYAVMMSMNGCIDGPTNFIVTVNPIPVVTNSPVSSSQCSGATFNLALSSSVAGSTYNWTANGTPGITGYSGGTTGSINQTILNSTSSAGTVVYTITPTANACNGIPVDYTLTVNPNPIVNLSINSQAICSGTVTAPVTFNSAVAGTTYAWTATPSGAGITGYTASGTASIPAQTLNSTLVIPGNVSYTVIPTYNGCSGTSATHIATVNPIPVVTNASMSQTICNGATSSNVNLLSNVAGTTFTWIATSSSASVSGFMASGGNTIPAQTIFNNGITAETVTYQIIPTSNFNPACPGTPAIYTININPSPAVNSSLVSEVCSGQPFSYTIGSNLSGTTFTWSRAAVSGISNAPGSGSSTIITETLINTTNNNINVIYVLTPIGQAPSMCPGIPVNLVVTVRALPLVNSGADFTIPYGTFTTLNGTASGGTGALNYTWTPNSYINTGANTLIPQTTNLILTRTYTLTVTDAAGCSANDPMTVFVVGTPVTASPSAAPASICFGQSTTLNANPTGGSGTYTYSWTSVPAGYTSTSATATISPFVSTVYTVTVNDGFNSSTASVSVTVNPLPSQFVLTGGGSYCLGGSGVVIGLSGSQSGITYQLYNNITPIGSPVSGTAAAISFGNQTLAGIYTVIATRVSTGCTIDMGSSVAVVINSLPVANAGADQTIAFGISTTLNGSASGGFGAMNYAWMPLAYIASGSNSASPLTTNLYSNTTYTLTVTDGNGCVGADQVAISLTGNAINVIASTLPSEICADASTAQLTASVSGGSGTYTFAWTCLPAGLPVWTSTAQNPVVSPDVTTTYSVTANDGFNTAIASVTVIVNPLPLQYGVTGGGSYCYAGPGVNIGLSGSQPNTNYQLLRGGIPDGPAVTGTGAPISFGNRTTAFNYTVNATHNITGCTNIMNGSATVLILPPPSAYLVTGGGTYPIGGAGKEVGLAQSDMGISYQLFCNNIPVGSAFAGTGSPLNFGFQTQSGTYTVEGTDMGTGCTALMNGSVNISILPFPLSFNVYGGGVICQGQPGLYIHLTGSESSIDYQLLRNGFPYGALEAGTDAPMTWGPFIVPGLFEVRAINTSAGISQMMNDSAVIIVHPAPTIFSMNPTGSQCPGTIIRLNGSDSGLNYYLLLNGITMDSIAGTGVMGFLDFGPQFATGTYTIKAVNIITGCEAMMNGSTFISIPPQVFNVIPAGILCPGQVISLTGSEIGVNYQLRWNGTFDLGAPVAGTGSSIVIGLAGLPGIYSAIAIDATTNCVSYMNDSATLFSDPTVFTITPDGAACEGDIIGLNGSEVGVEYVLLLDNAIHLDSISGTGSPISFGVQLTAGNYTILAVSQFSYCQLMMNGTTIMNDSPIKYHLLPAGLQCVGTTVSLSNSQNGVSYQLLMDGIFNIGSPVAGTGSSISFGPQSLPGTYTIRAVNDITGCNTMMIDSTVLESLPSIFITLPGGSHCAGSSIGLNGSELNFNYILVLNGTINMDTIAGTGGVLDFGPQFIAGNYTVIAYNSASYCSSVMNGSSIILAAPINYAMTPSGIACEGASVGLANSEIGINYQLRWNGSTNIGVALAGTGSAIDFGPQILTGSYTVIATNSNGCFRTLSTTVEISPLPVAFNTIPSGTQCQGTALGLDGSEVGVNYILVLNGNVRVDTISGTGSSINFGSQLTSGSYSIEAYFVSTYCSAVMNGTSIISNVAPAIYSMTPAGIICAGAIIGLDNSELGATYQLRMNGTINMGIPVTGTGAAISFGVQTLSGVYTAIATNANGCTQPMSGSVVINANPTAFNIIPTAGHCPETTVGIDGSQTGVNYVLLLDSSISIDTIAGTGSPLTFGVQTTTGTYTVLAYNATSLCQTLMNGTTIINPAPIAFNLTPAGINCIGSTIGLDNSEIGVTYQLRWNTSINIGSVVSGTGSAISFGPQSLPGNYTVLATNGFGCYTTMNSTVVLNSLPVAFNIVPSGTQCQGTTLGLDGSEVNANYILFLNGSIVIDTISGTGSTLSFGPQLTSGNYTVEAYFTTTNCASVMSGTTIISNVAPAIYSMTPAGIICSGSSIGLDNSELGALYQLRLNGTINMGVPVAGTGSAISFGVQAISGVYTAIATNSNGCSSVMTGNVLVNPNPTSFSITPLGGHCPGSVIGTNGSETGVNYVLVLDGSIFIDTLAGTGSTLSFGAQTTSGTYTIVANNVITLCQTTMSGTTVINQAPSAYNMTPAGVICVGAILGIDGSEIGVNYQLRRNGTTNVGSPVAGTGSPISFGAQTISATYTVEAAGLNACPATMNGNVVMNASPTAFTLFPAGSHCPGTILTLNGSETGMDYILYRDNIFPVDTIAGTGSSLNFGSPIIGGTYTVKAVSASASCQAGMNGSTIILTGPTTYNVTPAGILCTGTIIGLDDSEAGVNYQLRRNGTTNVGAPMPGTGSAISFGTINIAGTYTVIATSTINGCVITMNGSAILQPNPLAFSIAPQGVQCAGVSITLNGSETGTDYVLVIDNVLNVDTISGTGNVLDFGPQITTGTYTIKAVGGSTTCQSAMLGSTQVMANPAFFNITPAGLICATAIVGLDGSETGVNYTLYKNSITTGITVAGTGNAISFGVQPHGNYTVKAVNQITNCGIFMSGTLVISSPPQINTGADVTICAFQSVLLNATVTFGTTISWSKSGDGIFSNPNSLVSIYSPGVNDIAIGSVNLMLTAIGTGSCSATQSTDTLHVTINPLATANAGGNISVCSGSDYTIHGSATNYATVSWTTSGTGTFIDGTTLTPVYQPSAADLTAGSVTITMLVNAQNPCSNLALDVITMSFNPIVAVNAGIDDQICEGNTFTITTGSVLNNQGIVWTTTGNGTFSGGSTITATYTPGAADIATGSVQLIATASSLFPCSNSISDTMMLTIIAAPVSNAGANVTICENTSLNITDASALNFTTLVWNTSGSGNFSDSTVINPAYTPSASDVAAGSVTLTLTVTGNALCNQETDQKTVTFILNPIVFAGDDSYVCASPYQLSGASSSNCASILWTILNGTGTILNPATLTPTYVASQTDISNGFAILKLTGSPMNPCANPATDFITLSISNQSPVAFFSYDMPNCSNEAVNLVDLSHTLYGYISQWVWNYGDGSPNDTIQFPDQPNQAHMFTGAGIFNVTLTITNSFGCDASVTIPVDVIEAPIANFQYTNNCSDLVTSFQDASFANGPGNTVQYWWNFGDPATGFNNTSDIKDPIHLFSAPGTYQVMHVVRNFNNCTDTIIKPVTILTPVAVDFVFDYTCVNGSANFTPDTTIMNVADIMSWAWDFGDGNTSIQQNTVNVYAAPGVYKVTLTVTDISGCTASKTRTVTVNPLPVAMFNISQIPCANEPVHFDDVSAAYAGFISEWNWDFGDGNTQTVLHPANPDTDHTYANPGTFTVKLTIKSSDSCTAERFETIVINPAPTANFDFENPCQGTPVQFNDLTQTAGTGNMNGWSWIFGDGASGANNTSTLQNPTHTYAASGTYQVSLTVSTANGCTSTVIKDVVITVAPFVDFNYDNHCVSTSIQFTPAGSVNTATWSWSFGDGITSALPNPQHTYNTPGNYNVMLTITNTTGCQNTISHIIQILPAPVANFSTTSPACSQHQVNFTNQSTAAAGYIMRWKYNFGDGTTTVVNFPANPNVSHTYSTYGNYTVSLTVVTNDSCYATTTRNVQILQSPLANFDFDVTCMQLPVQFTDLSQGNMISWAWNFGDPGSGIGNTSYQQNPVHTYQQAGNYTVKLLIQNVNGCNDTVSRTITILPKPVVDFSFNNGCAADTVNFNSSAYVNVATTSTWLWEFGDNTTSSDTDPFHVYMAPGTYNVTLTITNQNGCTNVKTRQVQVTTAPIALYNSNTTSCTGTAVLFTDLSSTTNGTISTWNWDFGDGTILTVNAPANPNVTHTYTAAGIYDVALTIYTSTGCEAFYTSTVTVIDAPLTSFSFTGSCSGIPTFFTDLSQASSGNIIIGWSWDFGDPISGINNVSTLPDPQHIFSGQGTHNVTLTTVNLSGCTSSQMQVITVTPEPAVDFTTTASCDGLPVLFTADPTVTNIPDVASYLWNFGDGSATSTLASPEHLYTQVGTYTATLSITNLTGCGNSVSREVIIHNLPVAQFTTTGNCTGNLVEFSDISYNPGGEEIVAWLWDFGVSTSTGDTSSLQNPAYVYTQGGSYTVTLTVTNEAGCTSVKVMPVNVIPAPVALYSYTAEPCHNGSVLFKDESTSSQSTITAWYWEFASGVYSTLQNPVHVFAHTDSCFNVKLVVTTANGCTDTLVQEVCIPSGLEVAVDFTQTCFGEPTWFIPTLIQPTGGSIAFYNWNFGDPSTGILNESKLSNPEHTFSKTGTFIVSLQATDVNNCISTTYKTITVDALPKAAFDYNGGECDSLVTFKDMTTGAAIASWTWEFGDGQTETAFAPSSPDVNHYYPYPGIYQVTLTTLSEAGCIDMSTQPIRRTPCISAKMAITDTTVCPKRNMRFTEASTCEAPIASWQWFFGDNTSVTYTTPQPYVEHTYAAAGNYTVRMVVATQMVGGMVTDTATSQVNVRPSAKAAFTWQDVCLGNTTEFSNLTQNNNTTIKSYNWNFGDPTASTDTTTVKHPSYAYGLSGEYEVKLVVINTLGCSDTIVNTVKSFAAPTADFNWNSSCEANPVVFTDNSDTTNSAITRWNWVFSKENDVLGASTSRNCTFIFPEAGIYNVDMKITDRNGCATEVKKEVAINSSPVAAFSIVDNYENKQGQIMLNNGTINGLGYEWNFGNGTTSSGLSPIATYDKEGSYEISLITWNGQNCADTLIMTYDLMYKGLFVPNAFEPGNMNSEVQIFKPKGTNLMTYYLEIYDRWGNLLWSTSKLDTKGSPTEGWDGKLHGEVMKQDVYLWKISARFKDGTIWDGQNIGNNENMPQTKAGTVTLIR